MDIDYTVGEVELSYKPKFKNIYKVVSSEAFLPNALGILPLIGCEILISGISNCSP